jgi:hypothetical protein
MIFATGATQFLAQTTSILDGRKNVSMTPRIYLRAIVPIGVFYSMSLVSSNLAYLHLSVAFIQMLKVRCVSQLRKLSHSLSSLSIIFELETFLNVAYRLD